MMRFFNWEAPYKKTPAQQPGEWQQMWTWLKGRSDVSDLFNHPLVLSLPSRSSCTCALTHTPTDMQSKDFYCEKVVRADVFGRLRKMYAERKKKEKKGAKAAAKKKSDKAVSKISRQEMVQLRGLRDMLRNMLGPDAREFDADDRETFMSDMEKAVRGRTNVPDTVPVYNKADPAPVVAALAVTVTPTPTHARRTARTHAHCFPTVLYPPFCPPS